MFQIQVETDAQVPGLNPMLDYDTDCSALEIVVAIQIAGCRVTYGGLQYLILTLIIMFLRC